MIQAIAASSKSVPTTINARMSQSGSLRRKRAIRWCANAATEEKAEGRQTATPEVAVLLSRGNIKQISVKDDELKSTAGKYDQHKVTVATCERVAESGFDADGSG
ncbi:hypothetical protein [Bradyrhizobium sp. S3.2.12]|uniref:hypothetical protein n=1 Tax=Bradyrhizobium sp. S3.2.12 TaxID=3156387 RepID=UPI00339B4D78